MSFSFEGPQTIYTSKMLLRVDSSLQGVSSCLPDFKPSSTNGRVEDLGHTSFLIAGAAGSRVGSIALREKAANVIHAACKHLLEEKSDDSILLLLVIRIMDALGWSWRKFRI